MDLRTCIEPELQPRIKTRQPAWHDKEII